MGDADRDELMAKTRQRAFADLLTRFGPAVKNALDQLEAAGAGVMTSDVTLPGPALKPDPHMAWLDDPAFAEELATQLDSQLSGRRYEVSRVSLLHAEGKPTLSLKFRDRGLSFEELAGEGNPFAQQFLTLHVAQMDWQSLRKLFEGVPTAQFRTEHGGGENDRLFEEAKAALLRAMSRRLTEL
jgi:hypothetical protein